CLRLELLPQVQQGGVRQPIHRSGDKVRFLEAEVLEVMLYGCVTWTFSPGGFDKLREAHRGMLLRCLNAYTSTRAAPDYHMLSYLE
ncbi:unnamed protein product, partial [Ascophyllum nodosum]